MSVLPFISFFLLTIAGFFVAMQSMSENGCYRGIVLLGEFRAERAARNQVQSGLFEAFSEEQWKAPQKKKKKVNEPKNSRLRNFKRISEKHKLNIYQLLQTPHPESTLLYHFSLQLLRALYSHCDFYTENYPETILHCLLEAGKKWVEPDNQSHMFQLIPSVCTELDNYIIYQTLRGTNYYDVDKQEGIPPLLDFFTVSSDKKHKPLYFPLLRRVYLNVAFGEKCAQALFSREEEKQKNKERKNKNPILTKSELLKILEQLYQDTAFHFEEIMAYSRPHIGTLDKQQALGTDPNTRIHVRKSF